MSDITELGAGALARYPRALTHWDFVEDQQEQHHLHSQNAAFFGIFNART